MASSNPKIDNDNGFLKVVDPNPPGREVIPVEDLFIYVKLTARAKNRCGPDGDETEVNFIATKLDSSSEDNISYATTDYTEIGGLSVDQNKQGTLEGFGIKSIGPQNLGFQTHQPRMGPSLENTSSRPSCAVPPLGLAL